MTLLDGAVYPEPIPTITPTPTPGPIDPVITSDPLFWVFIAVCAAIVIIAIVIVWMIIRRRNH